MSERPDRTTGDEAHSLARPIMGLAATLAILAWIALAGGPSRREAEPAPQNQPEPAPAVAVAEPTPTPRPVAPASKPTPRPTAAAPAAPTVLPPDPAAVAAAEAALDQATRLRAAAENRVVDAELALKKAATAATADAAAGRALAFGVKDPSARIERAANRAATVKWEKKKIQAELTDLALQPRTRVRPLFDQSAVARPVDGREHHFEVRGDRVAPLEIERLTDLIKSDARSRLRQTPRGRPIVGTVGPIGEFSMKYTMAPAVPEAIAEVLEGGEFSYGLRGWEIIPTNNNRGETYEEASQTISNFNRAINRLDPGRATVTMWVYPDGYVLYRRLRDELHARGFLVAARPLPAGMAIRGSPGGSLSAGQ